MTLAQIDPAGERAAAVREALAGHATAAVEALDGNVAGFALVVWDMRGACHSVVSADHGPVSSALLPTYVHDALNRHTAVVLAQTVQAEVGSDA